jgi:hypothetical protein
MAHRHKLHSKSVETRVWQTGDATADKAPKPRDRSAKHDTGELSKDSNSTYSSFQQPDTVPALTKKLPIPTTLPDRLEGVRSQMKRHVIESSITHNWDISTSIESPRRAHDRAVVLTNSAAEPHLPLPIGGMARRKFTSAKQERCAALQLTSSHALAVVR